MTQSLTCPNCRNGNQIADVRVGMDGIYPVYEQQIIECHTCRGRGVLYPPARGRAKIPN